MLSIWVYALDYLSAAGFVAQKADLLRINSFIHSIFTSRAYLWSIMVDDFLTLWLSKGDVVSVDFFSIEANNCI